jgi:hypothetical protein
LVEASQRPRPANSPRSSNAGKLASTLGFARRFFCSPDRFVSVVLSYSRRFRCAASFLMARKSPVPPVSQIDAIDNEVDGIDATR